MPIVDVLLGLGEIHLHRSRWFDWQYQTSLWYYTNCLYLVVLASVAIALTTLDPLAESGVTTDFKT